MFSGDDGGSGDGSDSGGGGVVALYSYSGVGVIASGVRDIYGTAVESGGR